MQNEKLKQLGRFASLNHNIYITTDPTTVGVDHAVLAGWPTKKNFTEPILTIILS